MTKPHEKALQIRQVEANDRPEWMRLRAALWPEYTSEDHRKEMNEYLGDASAVAFVAERPDGRLAGFVEATIRSRADACDTSPVGYVEGWYVDPDVRLGGIGRRLVRAVERWALGRGCVEMGSDCLVDNVGSLRAHLAIGYEERERLIHFRKWLARPKAHSRDRPS